MTIPAEAVGEMKGSQMTVLVGRVEVPGRVTRWGFVAHITPDVAKSLLSQNRRNRPKRATRIELYARDMAARRWWLNGEAIVSDTNGDLLNGQHRLESCVLSGEPFESYFIGDIQPAARDSFDQGLARSTGDVLAFEGEPQARTLASGLAVAWRLENNGHLFSGAGQPWPTRDDLLAYLRDNPNIRHSLGPAEELAKAIRYQKSVGVALHYLMSSLDEGLAEEFFCRLADGVGLYPGNPVLALRTVMLKNIGAVRRLTQNDVAALTIKSWRAFRERRSIKSLRWTRGGKRPEAFPSLTSGDSE